MAMCISSIAKTSLKLFGKNIVKQVVCTAVRHLYSPNSMGISGYMNARDYVKSQFVGVDHLFFQKMKEFINKQDGSLIFTEDLKTMLHLVQKREEDLELLYEMLKKYNSQNNLRFGNFVFGTVAMRAFYHLDEVDLALKAFKDPQLDGFFDQIMTYQLLMDMLYNHQRYAEVREIYDVVKTKNVNGITHPRNPFIIVASACFKENTKESYDYILNLFKEVQQRGYEVPRRAIAVTAKLALKQNAPDVALEIASLARNARYIDVRCVKVEAFAALKRIDEIMVYFRDTLQADSANRRKQSYFKDTIEAVDKLVESEQLPENHDLIRLLNEIKQHDYIQDEVLESHICSTIELLKQKEKPWERQRPGSQPYRKRFGAKTTYSERTFTDRGFGRSEANTAM
ncbi:hypothetical protein QAD02_017349 [Eretmocerus hayati]|uniref:Uncharacterized protein n=1 Tax=Eretmocerus hayati TaxID=131215 RepID=A0ACC2PDM5_9HYME|nr:hypothetical protein QAD02_017349 [Eretmocerus hayati]